VRDRGEALAQPQTVHREMVVEVQHRSLGAIPIVNRPIKFDAAQPKPAATPILGQDTDAVLAEVLELGEARIAQLRKSGVVA
jgi:crotonobetainyl-CoA:carnitine CoA-transferase CaiB-like acyl-CoA transferase